MAADGVDDDPLSLADGSDPFDTPTFARTYVVTFVIRVAGAVTFVAGCGLAFVTRPGAAGFVVAGAAVLVGGGIASSVSAYRVVRSLGQDRYTSWRLSRPWAHPSLSRYRDYRAQLRDDA